MAKKVQAMLPAELAEVAEALRPDDELLTAEELETFSLFESLKKAPSFARFPGSTVLRRCRPGRVMCTQGEAGATAFFILTTDDVLKLRERQLASIEQALAHRTGESDAAADHQYFRELSVPELRERWQELVEELTADRERTKLSDALASDGEAPATHVATANLFVTLDAHTPQRGWWPRLLQAFSSRPSAGRGDRPKTIPIDGPVDINANTMHAHMHEGELFGEMSCLNRSPRSATIVVDRDCYMLEMLRNVVDMLHSDPVYKSRMDDTYRQRVLEGHVRRLSVFEELTDEDFERLRNAVELVDFEAGAVIFEEHEPSDSFYVIRSGLVKVVSNAWCQLREREFQSIHWGALPAELAAIAQSENCAARLVWDALAQDARAVVEKIATDAELDTASRVTVLSALNRFIVQGDVHVKLGKTTLEAVAVVGNDQLRVTTSDFPHDCQKWSDLESREFHRLLLEHLCPHGLPRRAATCGPRRTLTYLGRGDFFGEIGVMLDELRTATCYAYDHPDGGFHQRIPDSRTGAVPSRVELVRIGKPAFQDLLNSSVRMRQRVESVASRRKARSRLHEKVVGDESIWGRSQSPEFEQLGLIQGQKLMLIDLDRCTRCGACVDACVHAHPDGRTRLYLDGPRFEKYLVPLTCRQCLDPVCMIGCPVGSINRGDNGEIRIENWCIGCRMCAEQCPYGSIHMNELHKPVELTNKEKTLLGPDADLKTVTERAVVCDLCSALPSQDPSCVYACPHAAALRVNAREFFFTPSAQSS